MLGPRRELQSELALDTIMFNLTDPEITEDKISGLIAGYDGDKSYLLGKILGSIDIKNSTLKKVLSNSELKKCITGSLMDAQAMVGRLTSSLFCDVSLSNLENDFKAESYKLTKANDERLEEKESLAKAYGKIKGSSYIVWWIRSFIYTEQAQIRYEINRLKQDIRECNEGIILIGSEITRIKLKIEDLEKTLNGYDFSQVSNWDNLIKVVRLIAPEDDAIIAKVEDFLIKLKDYKQYPEIKFFQFYIINSLVNPLQSFWTKYKKENPLAGPLKVIYDMLFMDNSNKNNSQIEELITFFSESNINEDDIKIIGEFRRLQGKYLQITNGSEKEFRKTYFVPQGYSDKKILLYSDQKEIYPEKYHKYLFDKRHTTQDINGDAIENFCASIVDKQIIVQFPIEKSYGEIYKYCFCTTIMCFKELQNTEVLKSKIKNIEESSKYNIADTVKQANEELRTGDGCQIM